MEQSPRKWNRGLAWIVLVFLAISTLSGCRGDASQGYSFGPTWSSTRVEQLAHGVEVRTEMFHGLYFFQFGYFEWLPVCLLFPDYHTYDERRAFLADGEEWFSEQFPKEMLISPGQTYVVIASTYEPLRILDLPARRVTELVAPASRDEFPGRHGYPFKFLRWEDDASFLVEVRGSYMEKVKDENGNDAMYTCSRCDELHQEWDIIEYIQTWRIDAKTATRVPVDNQLNSWNAERKAATAANSQ